MPLTILRSEPRGDRAGFTLVELLIVVFLLAIVGSIVGVSMVRGLRAESHAQARIEAFEDMQIGLERMSREVRAARFPLLEAAEDEVKLDVLRGGQCLRFHYWVEDGQLWSSETRSADDCTGPFAPDPPTENVFVPNLGDSAVFEFLGSDMSVLEDEPIDETKVFAVRITLTRDFPGDDASPPVTVRTTAGLRNAS